MKRILAMQNTIMGKTIEEEISQKKFRNSFHKIQLNILFTAGWIESHHLEVFKKYTISPQQYNVLRILRGSNPLPCSIQLIRSRMLDKMSDTSRIVVRLQKIGLVNRATNLKDRRSAQISITQKGLSLLRDMEPEESNFDNLASNLSSDEADQLSLLLDKLRN